VLAGSAAHARPNTHAPAISTWDPRASSVVFALGRAVSGDGDFTLASYNANFSSTSGILSAQFGAHYVTYGDDTTPSGARGFSAGGVALISLPLSSRSSEGIPGSTFAFYLGGVPTALFSGQRNFISVPLVLGVGVPLSPASAVTITPWAELSPGLNFDTRIQAVSTSDAIQSAMDGTLTRQEVEELVEEGLDISRDTTLGTRAGISLALHLGRDVDLDANLMIGAGHDSAIGLGAGLVFRWDSMVPGVLPEGERRDGSGLDEDPRRLRRDPSANADCPPAPAPAAARDLPARPRERSRASPPARGARPTPAAAPSAGAPAPLAPAPPSSATAKKKDAVTSAPATSAAPVKPASRVPDLPPLQAAPPKSP
jgi:hypothetical protein